MELVQLNQEIIACRKCPRLVAWREAVTLKKRRAYFEMEYWGKPVPGFGDRLAGVLVVGLAPGAHGSNRTGRQFTGDASGAFLYPALYRAGFASQPQAISREDGLRLQGLYVTAAGRCAPPKNKPTLEELNNCQPYLEREIQLIGPSVVVCLGRVAFDRILRVFSMRRAELKFIHGAIYRVADSTVHGNPWLVCSYHPSQQNTRTGRLTAPMFDQVWAKVIELVASTRMERAR